MASSGDGSSTASSISGVCRNILHNPAPICMFYFAHPFGISTPLVSKTKKREDLVTRYHNSNHGSNKSQCKHIYRKNCKTNSLKKVRDGNSRERKLVPWPRDTWARDLILPPLLQVLARQHGHNLPDIETILTTVRNAWNTPTTGSHLQSRDSSTSTWDLHTYSHSSGGVGGSLSERTRNKATTLKMGVGTYASVIGAGPGLIKRRYSVPEIIMRKHSLAQQKNYDENSPAVSTANSAPTPYGDSPTVLRTPNSKTNEYTIVSGSESNLSRGMSFVNGNCVGGNGGPNNYYYTNGPLCGSIGGGINGISGDNSMRKSMLLRKIWNKELRRKNYAGSKDTRSGSWSPPLRRTQRRLYTNSSFSDSIDNAATTSGERCKECEKIENESVEGSPKRLRLISTSTSSLTSATPSTKSADSCPRFVRYNSCDSSNDKDVPASTITNSVATQGAITSSSSSRQQETTTNTASYTNSSRTETPPTAANQTAATKNRKTVLIYMTSMDTPSLDDVDNGNSGRQDVLRIELEAPTTTTSDATKSSSTSKTSTSTGRNTTTATSTSPPVTTNSNNESSESVPTSSAEDGQRDGNGDEGHGRSKRDISASSAGDESSFSDNNNNSMRLIENERKMEMDVDNKCGRLNSVIELNANTIRDKDKNKDYAVDSADHNDNIDINDQKLDVYISEMLIDNLNNIVLDTTVASSFSLELENQINNNNIKINVNEMRKQVNVNEETENGELRDDEKQEKRNGDVNLNDEDIQNVSERGRRTRSDWTTAGQEVNEKQNPNQNENSKIQKKHSKNGVNQIKNHELRTQDYNKLVINENHENMLNNNNNNANTNKTTSNGNSNNNNTNPTNTTTTTTNNNNHRNDISTNEKMCNVSNIFTPDQKSNKTVNSCCLNSEEVVIAPVVGIDEDDEDDDIDDGEYDDNEQDDDDDEDDGRIEAIEELDDDIELAINNNRNQLNFSENSFRLVSSAATPLSSLPPSLQQLANIGEFQINETFTGIHYFPIYTHGQESADLSSHTSCCSDSEFLELGPVGTGSSYPQYSFTQPVLVQRLSAYPRTESMEVQPSSTSVCEDDLDGSSDDDSISLVDSLDEPLTPKRRSNKLKNSACEQSAIVRKSPEAFFVPIVDGAQQIDEHLVVADTMPDKIKEKLEKRQKKRDQKKEQEVKKKQKKVQKILEKKFGEISVNGKGIRKERGAGGTGSVGSGSHSSVAGGGAGSVGSVGGSGSNSLINSGGSKNGNNKSKTNNSATTSQQQPPQPQPPQSNTNSNSNPSSNSNSNSNSTAKVVKTKKSMRNEIGLLESYKIDAKGNMQFQTPSTKATESHGTSNSASNNSATTNSSNKSIAFKLRSNSTSSQFNAKGMVKPKTSDIASIRRPAVSNDEKSAQESRRKQVLKDVQQMTLYQQADLTPDIEGGPRRMYQKTEIQEGDKRIEILEIVECGESSEENSPARHHMPPPSRNSSSRSGRRSRIPVPIFRAGRANGYQKSFRTISREGSPVTTPKSFSRNASPSAGNPKVDRMIADLLIEALNNPDDVAVEFIKSPKELIREKSGKRQAAARRTPTAATVVPGQRRSAHSSSKYRQHFEVIPEERSSVSVESSTDDQSTTINTGSSSIQYPLSHHIKDITNLHISDSPKKSPIMLTKSFATIELSPKLENLTPAVKHRNSPWLRCSERSGGLLTVPTSTTPIATSPKRFNDAANENFSDTLRMEILATATLKEKPPKIPNRTRKSESSAESSPRIRNKNPTVTATIVSTPTSSVADEDENNDTNYSNTHNNYINSLELADVSTTLTTSAITTTALSLKTSATTTASTIINTNHSNIIDNSNHLYHNAPHQNSQPHQHLFHQHHHNPHLHHHHHHHHPINNHNVILSPTTFTSNYNHNHCVNHYYHNDLLAGNLCDANHYNAATTPSSSGSENFLKFIEKSIRNNPNFSDDYLTECFNTNYEDANVRKAIEHSNEKVMLTTSDTIKSDSTVKSNDRIITVERETTASPLVIYEVEEIEDSETSAQERIAEAVPKKVMIYEPVVEVDDQWQSKKNSDNMRKAKNYPNTSCNCMEKHTAPYEVTEANAWQVYETSDCKLIQSKIEYYETYQPIEEQESVDEHTPNVNEIKSCYMIMEKQVTANKNLNILPIPNTASGDDHSKISHSKSSFDENQIICHDIDHETNHMMDTLSPKSTPKSRDTCNSCCFCNPELHKENTTIDGNCNYCKNKYNSGKNPKDPKGNGGGGGNDDDDSDCNNYAKAKPSTASQRFTEYYQSMTKSDHTHLRTVSRDSDTISTKCTKTNEKIKRFYIPEPEKEVVSTIEREEVVVKPREIKRKNEHYLSRQKNVNNLPRTQSSVQTVQKEIHNEIPKAVTKERLKDAPSHKKNRNVKLPIPPPNPTANGSSPSCNGTTAPTTSASSSPDSSPIHSPIKCPIIHPKTSSSSRWPGSNNSNTHRYNSRKKYSRTHGDTSKCNDTKQTTDSTVPAVAPNISQTNANPSGWSVTVAGNYHPEMAPDVEMRLSFPKNLSNLKKIDGTPLQNGTTCEPKKDRSITNFQQRPEEPQPYSGDYVYQDEIHYPPNNHAALLPPSGNLNPKRALTRADNGVPRKYHLPNVGGNVPNAIAPRPTGKKAIKRVECSVAVTSATTRTISNYSRGRAMSYQALNHIPAKEQRFRDHSLDLRTATSSRRMSLESQPAHEKPTKLSILGNAIAPEQKPKVPTMSERDVTRRHSTCFTRNRLY